MPVLCGAEQSVRTGVAKELNSSTSQSELYPEDRLSWSDRSRQRCGVLRKGRKRERGVTQLKSPAVKACFMKPGPLSNRATVSLDSLRKRVKQTRRLWISCIRSPGEKTQLQHKLHWPGCLRKNRGSFQFQERLRSTKIHRPGGEHRFRFASLDVGRS